MKIRKKLLFLGELPPKIVHGISLSNQRILSVLSEYFHVISVEDNSSFNSKIQTVLSFLSSLSKLFFISLENINTYYINTPLSYFGLLKIYLTVRLVRMLNSDVKVISHLHRGDLLDFIRIPNNKNLFEKFSDEVNVFIVLSEVSANELCANGLADRSKIKVLFNTVDVLLQSGGFRGGTTNNYYCLCNYIPTKRIDALVKISNDIGSLQFIFNGASSSPSYLSLLKKLNIKGTCEFKGSVFGLEKEKFLRSSRALVLPSLNEGMPLVILESLAQGTPVICFDVGYIKNYLGDDYPGLVKVLTDDAFKEKILWLDRLSSDDYSDFRAQSYNIFWNQYSAQIVNETVLKVFN